MDSRTAMMGGAGMIGFPLLIVILLRSLGPDWIEKMPPAAILCVFFVLSFLTVATMAAGYIAVLAAVTNRR